MKRYRTERRSIASTSAFRSHDLRVARRDCDSVPASGGQAEGIRIGEAATRLDPGGRTHQRPVWVLQADGLAHALDALGKELPHPLAGGAAAEQSDDRPAIENFLKPSAHDPRARDRGASRSAGRPTDRRLMAEANQAGHPPLPASICERRRHAPPRPAVSRPQAKPITDVLRHHNLPLRAHPRGHTVSITAARQPAMRPYPAASSGPIRALRPRPSANR